MLEIIIKRNGVEEPFIAKKANSWVQWAASDIKDRINWSSIVTSVVREAPQKMTSQDFQMALVKRCIREQDWPHQLMAGRLYAVWHWKAFYNDKIPSLLEQHEKLQSLKLMKKLDFTPEEYNKLEQVLNHSNDLNYAQFQIKQHIYKYAISNKITKTQYETPQFMFMRMAMALAERHDKTTRMLDAKAWYRFFSEGKINPPTPNFNNLGTLHNGYASCCLYATDDTARSIGVGTHIAYTMTYMSAGIGGVMEVRSILDSVRGGVIEHQGKMPYYNLAADATKANIQGGRGGAMTQYVSIFDPEIEDIIMLQNPRTPVEKQNRDIHFAVMYNSFFVKKANAREKIFTFNNYTAPDLYQLFLSSDREGFEELYNKYENNDNFKKKYLDAYSLAILLETQGHEVSTVYSLNIEETNRHTSFKEPIRSSNLCVAPETQILTDRGYFSIKALSGQNVNVWNGSEFSNTQIFKTGINQKLLKVVTDSGYELDCTPYHKWYIFDGYGKDYKEVRTEELKSGDKLCKFDLPTIEGNVTLGDAYINGFYSGDGCEVRNQQRIYLYGEKRKLAHLFSGGTDWYHQEEYDRSMKHYTHLMPKYFVPDANITISSRLEWFAGLVDADGCIYRNGDNQQLVLSSSEFDFLTKIQLMLQTLGISTKIKVGQEEGFRVLPINDGTGDSKQYWCKEHYRLLMTSNDLQHLKKLGFKTHRLEIIDHEPQRDAKQFVKILAVYDLNRYDDTYCFTEPKKNLGMFNGILTGQCIEITQPTTPYQIITDLYKEDHHRGEVSLCNLGAVNVAKYPLEKAYDPEYEEVCYYTLKMADTTIDMADYELPHVGYTAKMRRNAAIGMIGVAQYFATRGIKFDTPYGLEVAHKLAERHMFYVIRASLRLGRELGNAPWIDKTKWVDGWLPIDTYKKSVDKLTPHNLVYDWEGLREEIRINGGIRNSSLVSHMPTESSSKASGVPNGIYPVRDLNLKKTDFGNTLDWCAPDDDLYGDSYQLAYDIDTIDLIKYYAVIQKFTDQAISADFYMDRIKNPTLSEETLFEHFLTRAIYGLKSKYYQNSLTESNEITSEGIKPSKSIQEEVGEFTPLIGANERADCVGACTL